MSLWHRLFGNRAPEDPPEEEFDRWDAPLLADLRDALVRLLPPHWDSAALILEATGRGAGSGLSHSPITRTEGEEFVLREDHTVPLDAAAVAAIRKLEQGWIERGDAFQRAIITVWRPHDHDGGHEPEHDDQPWGIRSVYEG